LRYELTVNGKTKQKATGKRDQFAPELLYFSDCILNDRKPEPSGEEGMQDVRIIETLYRSAKTGRSIRIPSFTNSKRPSAAQTIRRPGIRKPRLVKVVSASKE
jgi:glucose-fructose oxidoreductase